MDATYEDDFPRMPGLRIDNDKALSEAGRDFDATTDEQHDSELEKMMRARAAMDESVLGEGEHSAVLEPDPEVFKKLGTEAASAQTAQAAAQTAAQTHEQVTGAAPTQATSLEPGKDAAQGSAEATASGSKELVKPHSVDEALAAIRLRDNSHQRRFVIVGDESIKRAFYEKLEQNGLLKYHNGTPVIGMSQKKTLKMLHEFVAKEYPGASANHALHMTARREGTGISAVTAGIKNALGSRSTVDVIVVGDQATQSEKMKELGQTLSRLQAENKLTSRGDGANLPVKDGKLELPVDQSGRHSASDQARVALSTETGSSPAQTRPVVLQASVGLGSLLLRSKDIVNKWEAEIQRLKDERNEPKAPKGENEKDAAKAPAEKVNEHAQLHAGKLADAFANPASLRETQTLVDHHGKDREQVAAETLLRRATVFKDPTEREIATLPAETRQQMVVHLAALTTKVSDKEYGEGPAKVLDEAKGGARSIREKVADYVKQEAASDAQFPEKAKALTQALVEQKALTPEQADRVNQMVAQATIQKEAGAEQAAPQAGAQADAARAPDAATAQAAAGTEAATAAAPAAATGTAPAQTTEAAAASVTPRDAAGSVESESVAPATVSTESGAGNQGGASFGDRLENVTKDGYEAVTERDARAVINELEVLAERRAPLSDLARRDEMGDPQDATRSLAQVRGLLLSASMGQFGDELATRATALHEAVRDWTNESKASVTASQEASLNNEASPSAAATASTQVADNAATGREQGNATGVPEVSDRASGDAFSARLTHALKDTEGASGLTTEQARGIISELESRQGQSLATLGEGEGRSIYPGGSRTLEQVKVVLLSAHLGQFGDDLAKRAEALAPAVREWTAQESDRMAVVKDELRAARTREDAVTATPVSRPQGDAPVQRTAEPSSTASTREATAKESSAASPTNDAAVLAKETVPNAGVRMARMQAGSGADAEQQSTRAPGQQTATGASATPATAEAKAAAAPARGAEHVHAGGTHRGAPAGAASEQTSAHAATLYKLMANPAGSFTRRDKSWNLSNLGKAAQAVAGLDLKETAKLSSVERTSLAAYSVWLADAANSGKLPGFTSPGGKQLAAQVTEKAAGLVQQVDGPLPASTQKEMAKAERMVDAKLEHDVKLERTAQVATQASVERAAPEASNMKGLVQDLVHAVYRQSEMNEGYANYLLKNAARLTPESLGGLDNETKARTVAALSFLAGEVRSGAMGDFEQLSAGVQRNVQTAQKVANDLYDHLSREPGMATTLTRAYMEVNHGLDTERERGARAEALESTAGKSIAKPESELGEAAGSRSGGAPARTRGGPDLER